MYPGWKAAERDTGLGGECSDHGDDGSGEGAERLGLSGEDRDGGLSGEFEFVEWEGEGKKGSDTIAEMGFGMDPFFTVRGCLLVGCPFGVRPTQ